MVYGGFYEGIIPPIKYGVRYIIDDSFGLTGVATPVRPETVGQYIGQRDIRGTRIFEGYILQYILTKQKYTVTLEELCVGTIDEKGKKLMLGRVDNDFEIVGNIYDDEF